MVKVDVEVLKNRIADAYDVVDVVDILGITVLDILDAFEDKLIARRGAFSDLENLDEGDDVELY